MEEKIGEIVKHFYQENEYLTSKIEGIQNENKNALAETEPLKAQIKHLKAENVEIKEINKNLQKKIFQQYEHIWELQDDLENIRKEIMFEFTTLIKTLEKQNTFVSFTAYATEVREYIAGDIIQFDGIAASYGNHYNSVNSTFTCPFSGYYLFTVSVLGYQNGGLADVDIRMDGDHLVSTLAEGESHHDASANAVVTYCQANQQVWVNCRKSSRIHGSESRHSTFHATLLRVV